MDKELPHLSKSNLLAITKLRKKNSMKPLEVNSSFHPKLLRSFKSLWALDILWSTASPGIMIWCFKRKKNCNGVCPISVVREWWWVGAWSVSFCPPAACQVLRFWRCAGETCWRWAGTDTVGGLPFGEGGGQLVFFGWNWILFLSTLRPPSYPAAQSSHSISISPCESWSDIKMWARDGEDSQGW